MQIKLSQSMRSITISTNSNGFLDLMKIKFSARHISYRIFHTVVILAFLLPFVFILTAVITLEGVNNCSSFVCLGRRLGPSFLSRGDDDSMRLMRDLYNLIDQTDGVEVPSGIKFPESFGEFLTKMKHNQYDAKTFAIMLKGTMENMDRELKKSRLAEQQHKHFAANSIPKGLHCLSLRLTDEYASNVLARQQLPPLKVLPLLVDNSYHHFVVATDNILAASVVVGSTVSSSMAPQMIVFHVITDKKTYPAMHSWFALNPISPAIVEVKGVHQFEWLTKENVPVLQAMEDRHGDNPRVFASNSQARSSKYVSLLDHLRIYLPELFPDLNKVVFLDDDVVVQRDLMPLWHIDLSGKVNGAVETCEGDDGWVMSKRFRTYFNFSHPLVSNSLDPNECAWAYGMNIFDLNSWRKTQIRETYHHWLKENLDTNSTMWKLGTLPPALIAFRGYTHPIDPSWHMLGLGYQDNTNLKKVRNSAVIHYNGLCKPWLDIGYRHLQQFWTKHVNYSNEFIRNCHILEPVD